LKVKCNKKTKQKMTKSGSQTLAFRLASRHANH